MAVTWRQRHDSFLLFVCCLVVLFDLFCFVACRVNTWRHYRCLDARLQSWRHCRTKHANTILAALLHEACTYKCSGSAAQMKHVYMYTHATFLLNSGDKMFDLLVNVHNSWQRPTPHQHALCGSAACPNRPTCAHRT